MTLPRLGLDLPMITTLAGQVLKTFRNDLTEHELPVQHP